MTKHGKRPLRPHGEVRQSQMLTSYGPGALVDPPRHAVIMGGLEGWSDADRQPITIDELEAQHPIDPHPHAGAVDAVRSCVDDLERQRRVDGNARLPRARITVHHDEAWRGSHAGASR